MVSAGVKLLRLNWDDTSGAGHFIDSTMA